MKKLLILASLVGFVCVAQAERISIPMINATSITVTNTGGVTNLNSTLIAPYGTNYSLLTYTNLQGTRVLVGETTADYKNLLADVDFWDAYIPVHGGYSNILGTEVLGGMYASPFQVSVVLGPHGGTASTANFVFKPVFEDFGTSAGGTAYEWKIALAAGAAAAGDTLMVTNVPAYLWPTAKGLRLDRIYVTAGASTSNVVKSVRLNGWRR